MSKSEFVNITPEMASEWLRMYNTHNRGMRDRTALSSIVNRYADDMANGRWPETGDSIKFAADGTLLDGQHRLAAIVRSGVTMRMLVVTGLDNQAQDVMDIGIARRVADSLKLGGASDRYSATVSAIARLQLMMQTNRRPSNPAALACARENYDAFVRAADVGHSVNRELAGSPSVYAFAYLRLADINEEQAGLFFEKLATGVGVTSVKEPVHQLRQAIIQNRFRISNVSSANGLSEVLGPIYKAWNAYRVGAPMGLLRYRHNAEAYPNPR